MFLKLILDLLILLFTIFISPFLLVSEKAVVLDCVNELYKYLKN